MRRKFVYNQETGKMQEVPTGTVRERKGPYVFGDIKPYQTVGPEAGKWITGRAQHRDYLRRHGLTEVGNERKYFGLGD